MKKVYVVLNFDGDEATMMAAEKNDEGKISPLANEKINLPADAVSNGVVNISRSLVGEVASMRLKLQNKLPSNYQINGLYIGAMCRSMHSEQVTTTYELEGRRKVSHTELADLEALECVVNSGSIVTRCCNGYIADDRSMAKIDNELASRIGRRDLAVVVADNCKCDYSKLVPQDVLFRGVLATSVAIARTVTTEQERIDGILSVHFASDSTCMTYYLNDEAMSTVVVPFGWNHIQHDMALDGFSDNQVKKILEDQHWSFTNEKLSFKGNNCNSGDLINAACSRIREIFTLGISRIETELHTEKLLSDLVATGAPVRKQGFIELMKTATGHNVRAGQLTCGEDGVLFNDNYSDARYIPMVSLINVADTACCRRLEPVKPPVVEPEPVPEEEKPVEQETKRGKKKHNAEKQDDGEKTSLLGRFIKLFGETED